MKFIASFEKSIRALSKERPRAGRSGVFYTPKKTQKYENAIRNKAISELPDGHKVPVGPVRLVVHITDEVPISWSSRERAKALAKRIYPKKGDLDNRVKAIEDALNGVYYVDDVQIVELEASMSYAAENRVYVAVYEIGSHDEGNNESSVGVGG